MRLSALFLAASVFCAGVWLLPGTGAWSKTRAELIEDCIREIRSGLKAGQAMTNAQRMLAEEQCRARAEAQLGKPSQTSPEPPKQ